MYVLCGFFFLVVFFFVLVFFSTGLELAKSRSTKFVLSLFEWVGWDWVGFTRTPWLWKAVIGDSIAVLEYRLWSRNNTAGRHPVLSDWPRPSPQTGLSQTHTCKHNKEEQLLDRKQFCGRVEYTEGLTPFKEQVILYGYTS